MNSEELKSSDKKQFLKNFVNFDEKRFDLDEYEQRLQRFEDYLKNRKDEASEIIKTEVIDNLK